MIWTNGIISPAHANDTAVQDVDSGNMELFGVDPEGPESNEFDQGDVNVPTLLISERKPFRSYSRMTPFSGALTMVLMSIYEYEL